MKTTCPVCQAEVEGATIAALTKHVKNCGKPKSAPRAPRVIPAAMATSWTLPVVMTGDRKIASQNLFKANDHWVYARDAKAWKAALYGPLFNAKLIGANLSWSKWVLTRFYDGRARLFDDSNLVGGAKTLFDALRYHGVVVDDDPTHFKAEYQQVRGPGAWRLELVEYRA